MSISLIQYKGKEILYTDYSKCKNSDEMLAILYELENYFKNSEGSILNLSNFSGAFANMKFMAESKRLKIEVFEKKLLKGAAIGIGGLQKVLLKAYNKISKSKLIFFENKVDALEFLIS